MGLDDPVVIALIVGAVILLFGSSKIPQLAKSLGTARREFDKASKGEPSTPQTVQVSNPQDDDPLVQAAKKEGISTQGKSRDQIASELSWKLNKK